MNIIDLENCGKAPTRAADSIGDAYGDMVGYVAMPLRFRVKEFALARGFPNARRLAEATGISANTVYEIWNNEKKYVHLETLSRIAAELKVPAEMLITSEPAPEDDGPKPKLGRPRKGERAE